jgi:hypothetical protein
MIVNGRADMGPADPGAEAVRQLRLRYRLAAQAADGYAAAGFTVVLQDIVLGRDLAAMTAAIRTRPLYLVVLAPRPDIVREREEARRRTRGKVAYKPGDQDPAALDAALRRQTPRIGLWLDTSDQTLQETADELLARVWSEGKVA